MKTHAVVRKEAEEAYTKALLTWAFAQVNGASFTTLSITFREALEVPHLTREEYEELKKIQECFYKIKDRIRAIKVEEKLNFEIDIQEPWIWNEEWITTWLEAKRKAK